MNLKTILSAAILLICATSANASCFITEQTGEPLTQYHKGLYDVCHHAYQVKWDNATKNPVWVQQIVSGELSQGKLPRATFKEEPQLPENIRVSDSDYKGARDPNGNQLARGHMAPADDFSGNVIAMSESFYFSNVIPQVQKCNNSGVWRTIEDVVRDWGVHYGHLIAVSGPIYQYDNGYIGNGVKIPSHLFKVVYNPTINATVAWIVPNSQQCGAKPKDFVVRQDDVERATGIKFFPQLSGYTRGNVIWP